MANFLLFPVGVYSARMYPRRIGLWRFMGQSRANHSGEGRCVRRAHPNADALRRRTAGRVWQ